MRNLRKLQSLVVAVRKDGIDAAPSEVRIEHLQQIVLLLADYVIAQQRELDDLRTLATRAARDARLMGLRR